MTEPKVKVKSITLEVGGQESRLTIDEARALHKALDGLFGARHRHFTPYSPIPYTPGIQPRTPNLPCDITPTCSFNELES